MKQQIAQWIGLGLWLAACAAGSGGSTSSGTTAGNGLPPGYTGNTVPGTCTPAAGYGGNSLHVGAYCTQGGGQCLLYSPNLICSLDVDPAQMSPWCLLQCTTNADCAEDACCHPDTQHHTSAKGCVPLGCPDGGPPYPTLSPDGGCPGF